jgi:hypothetical protein
MRTVSRTPTKCPWNSFWQSSATGEGALWNPRLTRVNVVCSTEMLDWLDSGIQHHVPEDRRQGLPE